MNLWQNFVLLVKLIIEKGSFNTDDQRKILSPSDFEWYSFSKGLWYSISYFWNQIQIWFFCSYVLFKKIYEFSLLGFKLYRQILITNDGHINHYQKVHRDLKDKFSNIMVKLKSSSTDKKETSSTEKKETSSSDKKETS